MTFAPGDTSKTVTVQVNGDTAVEPNETFNVNLSNATGNATILDGTGVGTITNDDAAASAIPINDVTEAGGQQRADRVRVHGLARARPGRDRSRSITRPPNGTATAPSDYASTGGTLTFAPGDAVQDGDGAGGRGHRR